MHPSVVKFSAASNEPVFSENWEVLLCLEYMNKPIESIELGGRDFKQQKFLNVFPFSGSNSYNIFCAHT